MGDSMSSRAGTARKMNSTAGEERRAMKSSRDDHGLTTVAALYERQSRRSQTAATRDRGVTLIETMIAVLVALIGVFSLGALIFQATVTNKNQGSEVTRAAIYAQDKIEKLLSFGSPGAVNTSFANYLTCTQTPMPSNAPCNSSGINASAWNTGLVGSPTGAGVISPILTTCPTSGPSVGYVDFLDYNGNQISGTSCSAVNTATSIGYIRMWQITDVSAGPPALKQVTVAVYSMAAVGQSGPTAKPVVVLTSLMSNPN